MVRRAKEVMDELQKQRTAIAESLARIDVALMELQKNERQIDRLIEEKLATVAKARDIDIERHEQQLIEIRKNLQDHYRQILSEKITTLQNEKISLLKMQEEMSAISV